MTKYKLSLLKRIAKYMDLTFEYVSDNELHFTCNEDKNYSACYRSFEHVIGLENNNLLCTIPLFNSVIGKRLVLKTVGIKGKKWLLILKLLLNWILN